MKSSVLKKNFIYSLLFILFVIIVFYFLFKEINFYEVLDILKNSNKIYILLGIFCMSLFSIFEALNLKIVLKLFGNKIKFLACYKYALAGFFASSITPSSSGGDPLQLYLMTKDKIPITHSAISLLVKLLSFQFVVVLISLISFFTSYELFNQTLLNYKYLVYLGMFLNTLVLILYYLMIFHKSIITYLVELVCKILTKIHYKKTDIFKEKMNLQIKEYENVSILLKENKKVLLRVIINTICQMIIYYTIPYFVYLSLGLNEYSLLTFISIQSVLFVSVSSLPFPGAVGISEVTFMHLYKKIFTDTYLASSMLITRFINFYIFVLYSGIVLTIFILKNNRR